MFRVLVTMSGRRSESFAARMDADGLVQVQGPGGVAYFPRANWIAKFGKKLYRGDFDGPRARAGKASEDIGLSGPTS